MLSLKKEKKKVSSAQDIVHRVVCPNEKKNWKDLVCKIETFNTSDEGEKLFLLWVFVHVITK